MKHPERNKQIIQLALFALENNHGIIKKNYHCIISALLKNDKHRIGKLMQNIYSKLVIF